MSVLIIADHNQVALNPAVYSLVSAAQKIGGDIDVFIAAQDGSKVLEEASSIKGIRRVLLTEAPYFAEELPENMSASVLEVSSEYSHILFIANPSGKAAAPRVAAKLDVAQISEVTDVVDGKTFKHPIYAGSVIETVRTLDEKVVLTVRATAFDPAEKGETAAQIERVVPISPVIKVTFVRKEQVKNDRPDLQSAKIVLAGGRGLVDEAEFAEMGRLADKLGAAVGTTRAVVDAGIAPNDWQIGQTGKIIAPNLYIGFGISGAIQHIAGIKDVKVIVAVNKDPEAPIFEVADYGLVADAMATIRELEQKL